MARRKQIKTKTQSIIRGVNYFHITLDDAPLLSDFHSGSLNSPFCSFQISYFSCIQWLLPHILAQYVAHSCFCLKTVQLINWLVCGRNKNHDSRWTIHLLLLNISNDTSSSFVLIGVPKGFLSKYADFGLQRAQSSHIQLYLAYSKEFKKALSCFYQSQMLSVDVSLNKLPYVLYIKKGDYDHANIYIISAGGNKNLVLISVKLMMQHGLNPLNVNMSKCRAFRFCNF